MVSFNLEMMFSSAGKRCFTIESLVAKENPLTAEEPICPAALSYSNPTTDVLMNGYQAPPARSLYQSPDLVFPETVNHPSLAVAPHQLAGSHLQHPHFFGTQHRDPLNFYPWVLRNRFFGHRFQGKKMCIVTSCFFKLKACSLLLTSLLIVAMTDRLDVGRDIVNTIRLWALKTFLDEARGVLLVSARSPRSYSQKAAACRR